MIPFNPCGAICDWGRFRYDTDCRFFSDSSATAKIRWYPALPDAVALPFPSSVTQRQWDDENYTQPIVSGPGEVYDAPKLVNHMPAVLGADGRHVCGTAADFLNGAKYDPTVNYPFRPDGLPLCCPGVPPPGLVLGGRGIERPRGGVLLGGRAVEREFFTVPSCTDVGAAHLDAPTGRFGLVLAPGFSGSASCFAYLGDAGTAPFHFRYEAGAPGTVTVFTLVHPSFCILGTILFSGPSDAGFEMDFTPTPTRDVCIVITHSPPPFTVAVMESTLLP